MQVLLMSAYDAASHRQWRRGLTRRLPEIDWTVLELPPRHFAWRVRGNPLSWWNHPDLSAEYDRILATSMVDLATLRGLNPALGGTPAVLYCHENQFAYPSRGGQQASVEPQMVQLYAALSAQTVLFNSDYNRRTFLDGAASLLGRFPDQVPNGVVAAIDARSQVLPVGLEEDLAPAVKSPSDGPLRLLWNHRWEYAIIGTPPSEQSLIITWAARWEYDKGPDQLLRILRGLRSSGVDFRINVLGQSFRAVPDEFQVIRDEFAPWLLRFGFIDSREEYLEVLGASHICLSTARHEFQGLAVLEAVAAGCSPVVPNDVVYPEIFDREFLYDSVEHAVDLLLKRHHEAIAGMLPVPDVSRFAWSELAQDYRRVILDLT